VKRLQPYGEEILRSVYGYIVEQAGQRGMRPVWIFMPQVREGSWQEENPVALRIATEAGFAVLNLETVYKGRDIETIRLAPWDDHPNALGHQLVADALYDALRANKDVIFAPVAPTK